MRSQLLKVSAIVLASALIAPLTFAQEEADAEAPPPPTPQEIAAENLDQLLNLAGRGGDLAGHRAGGELNLRVLAVLQQLGQPWEEAADRAGSVLESAKT